MKRTNDEVRATMTGTGKAQGVTLLVSEPGEMIEVEVFTYGSLFVTLKLGAPEALALANDLLLAHSALTWEANG